MGLTILAIPFLILGVLASPYALDGKRCFGVGSGHKNGYCFEQGSQMPETVKYGSMLLGFGLLYLGRRQIKRRRGG
jgi:hypothetical protein